MHLLDLTALVAGTQFRGQFESRIKGLVDEVQRRRQYHPVYRRGAQPGWARAMRRAAMNAANILKPALSRGEIQVIGATTFDEYRKYIEKDAALERRFQPVTVAEPSVQEPIDDPAWGSRTYYEQYHRVTVPRPEIARGRRWCFPNGISTTGILPDKAIDLLDEACASAGVAATSRWRRYDKPAVSSRKSAMQQRKSSGRRRRSMDYEELAEIRYGIAQLDAEPGRRI